MSGCRCTWSSGEPEQPDGKGVDLVLGWPAINGVLIEASTEEGIDKVGETGSIDLAVVLAVVFQEHEKAGSEGVNEIVRMDVAAADGPEGIEVGAELGVEAEYVEVKGEAKEGSVEMLVVPEAKDVVKVPGGEEGEERGR